MMVTKPILESVLTPALFLQLVKYRLPVSRVEHLNFSKVGQAIFAEDEFARQVGPIAWPALIALSKVGLDHMPDMMSFLPPPASPEFPEQCFGLQLLLDQVPRALFTGIDQRWRASYFDIVSQRLARSWRDLPAEQRPDTLERWRDAGASLDYWALMRFFLGAPWVHSESSTHQAVALEFTDETRRAIEAASGQTDPHRAQRQELLADVHAFAKVYQAGPPSGADLTREKFIWWMSMLMDIHRPIVYHFGRYPSANDVTGRENTEEERQFLVDDGNFRKIPTELAERIKDDVRHGRWTSLGDGREETSLRQG